jgi:predicted PurR-regulated permease PerM
VALGLVLVGFLPDAVIRTKLAGRTADLPASLHFVGFVGGVLTLGLIGFIAGPLLVESLVLLSEGHTAEHTQF